MPTITQTEYKKLVQRQDRVEKELHTLKEVVRKETEEYINPLATKRWERISRDLDNGKGRTFSSIKKMNQWLKNL